MHLVRLFVILFITASLSFTSCDILDSGSDDDEQAAAEELFELGSETSGNYIVDFYTERPVSTSYTDIYLDVRRVDSDERVEEAEITLTPIMDMGEHAHSAPVLQPEASRHPDSDLFEGAIIPTMPGGDMGSWHLEWKIDGSESGEENAVAFEVAPSFEVQTFEAANGEFYVLTWVAPESPELGTNDLILSLHHRESMMAFSEVQDLDLEIKPWMGSMDHGSEGNKHPEPIGDGRYQGVVSFNMSGEWQVYVTLLDDGEELYETEYELEVD